METFVTILLTALVCLTPPGIKWLIAYTKARIELSKADQQVRQASFEFLEEHFRATIRTISEEVRSLRRQLQHTQDTMQDGQAERIRLEMELEQCHKERSRLAARLSVSALPSPEPKLLLPPDPEVSP